MRTDFHQLLKLVRSAFSRRSISFYRQVLAISLVAALILTMPGSTAWAQTSDKSNSNVNIVSPHAPSHGSATFQAVGENTFIPIMPASSELKATGPSSVEMAAARMNLVPQTSQIENFITGGSLASELINMLGGYDKNVVYKTANGVVVDPRMSGQVLNSSNKAAIDQINSIQNDLLYGVGQTGYSVNPQDTKTAYQTLSDMLWKPDPKQVQEGTLEYIYHTVKGPMHAKITPFDKSVDSLQNAVTNDIFSQVQPIFGNERQYEAIAAGYAATGQAIDQINQQIADLEMRIAQAIASAKKSLPDGDPLKLKLKELQAALASFQAKHQTYENELNEVAGRVKQLLSSVTADAISKFKEDYAKNLPGSSLLQIINNLDPNNVSSSAQTMLDQIKQAIVDQYKNAPASSSPQSSAALSQDVSGALLAGGGTALTTIAFFAGANFWNPVGWIAAGVLAGAVVGGVVYHYSQSQTSSQQMTDRWNQILSQGDGGLGIQGQALKAASEAADKAYAQSVSEGYRNGEIYKQVQAIAKDQKTQEAFIQHVKDVVDEMTKIKNGQNPVGQMATLAHKLLNDGAAQNLSFESIKDRLASDAALASAFLQNHVDFTHADVLHAGPASGMGYWDQAYTGANKNFVSQVAGSLGINTQSDAGLNGYFNGFGIDKNFVLNLDEAAGLSANNARLFDEFQSLQVAKAAQGDAFAQAYVDKYIGRFSVNADGTPQYYNAGEVSYGQLNQLWQSAYDSANHTWAPVLSATAGDYVRAYAIDLANSGASGALIASIDNKLDYLITPSGREEVWDAVQEHPGRAVATAGGMAVGLAVSVASSPVLLIGGGLLVAGGTAYEGYNGYYSSEGVWGATTSALGSAVSGALITAPLGGLIGKELEETGAFMASLRTWRVVGPALEKLGAAQDAVGVAIERAFGWMNPTRNVFAATGEGVELAENSFITARAATTAAEEVSAGLAQESAAIGRTVAVGETAATSAAEESASALETAGAATSAPRIQTVVSALYKGITLPGRLSAQVATALVRPSLMLYGAQTALSGDISLQGTFDAVTRPAQTFWKPITDFVDANTQGMGALGSIARTFTHANATVADMKAFGGAAEFSGSAFTKLASLSAKTIAKDAVARVVGGAASFGVNQLLMVDFLGQQVSGFRTAVRNGNWGQFAEGVASLALATTGTKGGFAWEPTSASAPVAEAEKPVTAADFVKEATKITAVAAFGTGLSYVPGLQSIGPGFAAVFGAYALPAAEQINSQVLAARDMTAVQVGLQSVDGVSQELFDAAVNHAAARLTVGYEGDQQGLYLGQVKVSADNPVIAEAIRQREATESDPNRGLPGLLNNTGEWLNENIAPRPMSLGTTPDGMQFAVPSEVREDRSSRNSPNLDSGRETLAGQQARLETAYNNAVESNSSKVGETAKELATHYKEAADLAHLTGESVASNRLNDLAVATGKVALASDALAKARDTAENPMARAHAEVALLDAQAQVLAQNASLGLGKTVVDTGLKSIQGRIQTLETKAEKATLIPKEQYQLASLNLAEAKVEFAKAKADAGFLSRLGIDGDMNKAANKLEQAQGTFDEIRGSNKQKVLTPYRAQLATLSDAIQSAKDAESQMVQYTVREGGRNMDVISLEAAENIKAGLEQAISIMENTGSEVVDTPTSASTFREASERGLKSLLAGQDALPKTELGSKLGEIYKPEIKMTKSVIEGGSLKADEVSEARQDSNKAAKAFTEYVDREYSSDYKKIMDEMKQKTGAKDSASLLENREHRAEFLKQLFGHDGRALSEAEALAYAELIARDPQIGGIDGLKDSQVRMIVQILHNNIALLAAGSGKTFPYVEAMTMRSVMGVDVKGRIIVSGDQEISKFTGHGVGNQAYRNVLRAGGLNAENGHEAFERGKPTTGVGDKYESFVRQLQKVGSVQVIDVNSFGHSLRVMKDVDQGMMRVATDELNTTFVDEADKPATSRSEFSVGTNKEAEGKFVDHNIALKQLLSEENKFGVGNVIKGNTLFVDYDTFKNLGGMKKGNFLGYTADGKGNIIYTDKLRNEIVGQYSGVRFYTDGDLTQALRAIHGVDTNGVVALPGEGVHQMDLQLQHNTKDQNNVYSVTAQFADLAKRLTGSSLGHVSTEVLKAEPVQLMSHGEQATLGEGFTLTDVMEQAEKTSAGNGNVEKIVAAGTGTGAGVESMMESAYGKGVTVPVEDINFSDAHLADNRTQHIILGDKILAYDAEKQTFALLDKSEFVSNLIDQASAKGRGFLQITDDVRQAVYDYFKNQITRTVMEDVTIEPEKKQDAIKDAQRNLEQIKNDAQSAPHTVARDQAMNIESLKASNSFMDLAKASDSAVIRKIADTVSVIDEFSDPTQREAIAASAHEKGHLTVAAKVGTRALSYDGEVNSLHERAHTYDAASRTQADSRVGRTKNAEERFATDRHATLDLDAIAKNVREYQGIRNALDQISDVKMASLRAEMNQLSDFPVLSERALELSKAIQNGEVENLKDASAELKDVLNKLDEKNADFKLLQMRDAGADHRIGSESLNKLANEAIGKEIANALGAKDSETLNTAKQKLRDGAYDHTRNTLQDEYRSPLAIGTEKLRNSLQQAAAMWTELSKNADLSDAVRERAALRALDIQITLSVLPELVKNALNGSKNLTFAEINPRNVHISEQVVEAAATLINQILPSETLSLSTNDARVLVAARDAAKEMLEKGDAAVSDKDIQRIGRMAQQAVATGSQMASKATHDLTLTNDPQLLRQIIKNVGATPIPVSLVVPNSLRTLLGGDNSLIVPVIGQPTTQTISTQLLSQFEGNPAVIQALQNTTVERDAHGFHLVMSVSGGHQGVMAFPLSSLNAAAFVRTHSNGVFQAVSDTVSSVRNTFKGMAYDYKQGRAMGQGSLRSAGYAIAMANPKDQLSEERQVLSAAYRYAETAEASSLNQKAMHQITSSILKDFAENSSKSVVSMLTSSRIQRIVAQAAGRQDASVQQQLSQDLSRVRLSARLETLQGTGVTAQAGTNPGDPVELTVSRESSGANDLMAEFARLSQDARTQIVIGVSSTLSLDSGTASFIKLLQSQIRGANQRGANLAFRTSAGDLVKPGVRNNLKPESKIALHDSVKETKSIRSPKIIPGVLTPTQARTYGMVIALGGLGGAIVTSAPLLPVLAFVAAVGGILFYLSRSKTVASTTSAEGDLTPFPSASIFDRLPPAWRPYAKAAAVTGGAIPIMGAAHGSLVVIIGSVLAAIGGIFAARRIMKNPAFDLTA